jgi:uncharacterized protein with HEPN domain
MRRRLFDVLQSFLAINQYTSGLDLAAYERDDLSQPGTSDVVVQVALAQITRLCSNLLHNCFS